ncbi:hypothetical protein [Streptosporangium sp. NPDC000396]|uniref:hypothetical protein n=1 Tax=Streptosporangium sp. NPDC000396 TaxID=3366185 RepID=UPI0036C622AC
MSNASRNIQGILAVAALTAGVSWLVTAPASAAAASCPGRDVVELLKTPESAAAVCEEAGGVKVATVAGGTAGPADGEAGAASQHVDRLARIAGLPGLSRASAVISFADTAGAAAGAGVPALPSGGSGISWVGALPDAPDLPGLPTVPGTDFIRLPVPAVPPPDPDLADSDLANPADALPDGTTLPVPVPDPDSVKAVTEELPAAIQPPVTAPRTAPLDVAPPKVAQETAELPALDNALPGLGLE